MRELYEYEVPDRFVVGTVGQPGERAFYLQATKNRRITTIAIEKGQARVLADGLSRILDELHRSGLQVPMMEPGDLDLEPLTQPIDPEFHAQSMGLAWNEDTQLLTLEVHDEAEEPSDIPDVEEDAEDGPACMRVRLTLNQARSFISRTNKVVAAGRQPCQFCQLPLEPSGHVCPRSNGYLRSAL
jgi:uncharacterized repeat protein (TIGR03847 family)